MQLCRNFKILPNNQLKEITSNEYTNAVIAAGQDYNTVFGYYDPDDGTLNFFQGKNDYVLSEELKQKILSLVEAKEASKQ